MNIFIHPFNVSEILGVYMVIYYLNFVFIYYKQVPATKTLITPVQCKSLWSQFQRETEYTITQAIASQVSVYYRR